eukprot:TRINITY_DN7938_c0_g2_i2.p1 TRINITY_DN7938_c0_g2~~TRINITY_DN7938_c0_g2_i2.p1  ORF type:complete len:245 (+),score=49.49 TRINITY_DN7938_c0_g2_i2:167-901(+)
MSLVRSDPDTGELQGPSIKFGFTSRVCDVLKVRKKINVGPVYFDLGVDYQRIAGQFRYHATCKDRILEGHFGIKLPDTRIEYRKLVPLPTGGGLLLAGSLSPAGVIGNGFKPAFGFHYQFGGDNEQWPDFGCEGIKVQRAHQPTSQCQGSLSPAGVIGNGFKPAFGFHYQFGGDNEQSMWTADGLDMRKTVYLTKYHGIEVCGNLKVPLPQANFNLDGDDGDYSVDYDGAIQVNIAQINPVLKL